jgi:hypothetical protein
MMTPVYGQSGCGYYFEIEITVKPGDGWEPRNADRWALVLPTKD